MEASIGSRIAAANGSGLPFYAAPSERQLNGRTVWPDMLGCIVDPSKPRWPWRATIVMRLVIQITAQGEPPEGDTAVKATGAR
jgi:hypothetical protein